VPSPHGKFDIPFLAIVCARFGITFCWMSNQGVGDGKLKQDRLQIINAREHLASIGRWAAVESRLLHGVQVKRAIPETT
jgi:hypothetical protein